MLKKYILTSLTVAAAVVGVQAQTNTYSGYFLDEFLYRHQMNPALGNNENFVGFPLLGNISAGVQGNLHLSKFIYNLNGKTVLFTHPDLNSVSKFDNRNSMGVNLRENIINFGFKGMGGYNTVSIAAVVNSNIAVPGSLFNLLRDGVENKTYDIKNFNIYANAYAEIALNHSHEIKQVPGLRIGASLKILVGAANVWGKFERAELQLHENSWNIISEANIYASIKGAEFEKGYNEDANRHYVNGLKMDNFSAPNGYGAAVDLGATYKWRDFNFSLAVLDLGGIAWSKTLHASTNGVKEFHSSDHTFDINDGDATWDDIKDDISALYQLEDMGNSGGRSAMLGTTMNVGVEYELPYYRGLTFGLLNTTRLCGGYTNTEFRLSANITPVKYVSASANLVYGTYGLGFGWLLNITSGKGINLFVGMDKIPGKLTKQYVPLNSNANINFGINFPF